MPTTQQYTIALERANEIRMKRAALKADLRAGDVNPIRLIMDPPDYAEGMKVRDVFLQLKRVGPKRLDRIFRSLTFSKDRKIGTLTEREQHSFALAIRKVRNPIVRAGRKRPATSEISR